MSFSTKEKFKYLIRSALNIGQKKICPFCGSKNYVVIDKKYGVTSLLRCNDCHLQYRFPRDSEAFLKKFYSDTYNVDILLISGHPNDKELDELKAKNFDSVKSWVPYIKAFSDNPDLRFLDYGCNWGYSLYSAKKEGYDVVGYELSRSEAEFGTTKLGVDIKSDFSKIPQGIDVIGCSHVIEHLGDIKVLIQDVKQVIKPGGQLFIFCPNGNDEFRKRDNYRFHVNWGNLHPNFLTEDFFKYAFKDYNYLIMTRDWEYDFEFYQKWDRKSKVVDPRKDGLELSIVVQF